VPISFKVKAVKIGNSLRMTIPKVVVDYLQLLKGDTLEIFVTDYSMVVKKVTYVNEKKTRSLKT
jgi:antitoxin component of MazEF toxin-antitoxin module